MIEGPSFFNYLRGANPSQSLSHYCRGAVASRDSRKQTKNHESQLDEKLPTSRKNYVVSEEQQLGHDARSSRDLFTNY